MVSFPNLSTIYVAIRIIRVRLFVRTFQLLCCGLITNYQSQCCVIEDEEEGNGEEDEDLEQKALGLFL